VPAGFRAAPPQCSLASLDRVLGYFGNARFVCFRYEPRGEEVVWNDGQSYGFGSGGWQAFHQYVAPAARMCGADDLADVLVLDRTDRRAYFASRAAAEAFVARQSRPVWESLAPSVLPVVGIAGEE
jgi:hypothetical protein